MVFFVPVLSRLFNHCNPAFIYTYLIIQVNSRMHSSQGSLIGYLFRCSNIQKELMAMLKGGYFGRYLVVDLNTKQWRVEPLDEEMVRQYLGGRGLGTKFTIAVDPLAQAIENEGFPIVALGDTLLVR